MQKKLSRKEVEYIITALFFHAELNKISKVMLAQLIGVDLRQIYRWEHKEMIPRSDAIIQRILAILNVKAKKKLKLIT